MSNEKEVELCPFCGYSPEIKIVHKNSTEGTVLYRCPNQHAEWIDISVWNNRSKSPVEPKEVGGLVPLDRNLLRTILLGIKFREDVATAFDEIMAKFGQPSCGHVEINLEELNTLFEYDANGRPHFKAHFGIKDIVDMFSTKHAILPSEDQLQEAIRLRLTTTTTMDYFPKEKREHAELSISLIVAKAIRKIMEDLNG